MRLTEIKGYYARFILYVAEGYTHKKAWEKTQQDYEDAHGVVETKGFTSYESFRSNLHKWFSGKKL